VGAGPFFDVAVGAEVSPIEFTYDNRTYQLITLKVSEGLISKHPQWRTVGDFQRLTQTDIVLINKPHDPIDVHPEQNRAIEPDDTIVLFGPVATVRRISEANH
jgi:hypothetical protein